jgi:hypothetical protein
LGCHLVKFNFEKSYLIIQTHLFSSFRFESTNFTSHQYIILKHIYAGKNTVHQWLLKMNVTYLFMKTDDKIKKAGLEYSLKFSPYFTHIHLEIVV